MHEFLVLLKGVTADGGNKRRAGEKPHWKVDPSHEAAIFSHLSAWKHGHLVDSDSGCHPLVHLAWRALALAFIETHMADKVGSYDYDEEALASYYEGA